MRMTQQRWTRRPDGSNWGDFGPNDQCGSMNLVGPAQVRRGLAEVNEGRTFNLSLPLDYPGGNALHPRRHPPQHFATLRGAPHEGEQCFCFAMSRVNPFYTDVFNDDVVVLHTQYSTQWDGLAHAGAEFDADGDGVEEMVFYNGYRAGTDVRPGTRARADGPARWDTWEGPRAEALGIEHLAEHGVQGRAVMVDLHRHYGTQHHAVGYDDLMRICDRDRVTVERGDFLCLHSGLGDMILAMGKQPDARQLLCACPGLNGGDQRLLNWITDIGVPALISDNFAVELMPAGMRLEGRHAMLPLHEHCLFKNGIHLGELWRLGDLARWLGAHGRSRFLLTAPPLNLPGAAGSPVSPIATV
ncbi:cyclase family protein [Variovorax sp. GB1P17]|uniref:cyclase family protein n=1 Tax=Variovorax sp. GB1P17 TaxID=3443740 RepID=UPI003F4828DD